MPDDQTTNNPATSDASDAAALADLENNPELANLDFSLPNPEIEYATPSAYIDPDLPTTPTSIDTPEEPEEEAEPEIDPLTMTPEQIAEAVKASNAVMAKVAEKIANSRNILIALSSDPSVDELAAAISLSMFLDRLGKHAIAIYSGKTPDALAFLKPESTFESDADVLQDFVIALNKEKADHLRYRLDGDFVKIFITPYRDKIVAEDLEFSYGDYNVDLVLALNVNNGVDLDSALREYGRIMHDATVVNISTGNPGKFGEIEWNNRHASSVSEMISNLLLSSTGDTRPNSDEATALLTGIVAATDRFAKANTFPSTMEVASKLLDFGADQQLVAANVSDDVDNQFFTFSDAAARAKREAEAAANPSDEDISFNFDPTEEEKSDLPDDGTALKIAHGDEEQEVPKDSEKPSDDTENDIKNDADSESDSESNIPESTDEKASDSLLKPEDNSAEDAPAETPEDSSLLDELKATEASLSSASAETVPTAEPQPVRLDASPIPETPQTLESPAISGTPSIASPEMTIPTAGADGVTNKYSQMLEDALSEPASGAGAPMESVLPPAENPAASSAPALGNTPEVGAMPEINYGQVNDQVLPPPPTPPVDVNAPMPVPTPSDLPPMPPTPSGTNAAPAPDAFTIPGV